MCSGLLWSAVETFYRCYVRATKLTRQYPQALQLVEEVNDKAAVNDSGAGKSGLGIMYLDGALLLNSEEQDALLFIETATFHTKKNVEE